MAMAINKEKDKTMATCSTCGAYYGGRFSYCPHCGDSVGRGLRNPFAGLFRGLLYLVILMWILMLVKVGVVWVITYFHW